MTRILPFFAQTATATIVIDGVTYRVPLVDAAGHLQVDVVSGALPAGGATAAHQVTMITALELIDNLIAALATVGTDQLRTDVISSALPTGAATAAKQTTMITALQLIDDLRTALESVGTDRLNVNVKATGASEVMAAHHRTTDPSTTRATIATPASGKKIRIISCQMWSGLTTTSIFEVYFHTGADIYTNPGKEIMEVALQRPETMAFGLSWPDGGGPVGAVDEVVSVRVASNIELEGRFLIQYREE